MPVEIKLSMSPRPLTPPAHQDVHVWQWDLDASENGVERNWEILSGEERGRADKFRFERHRRRFVAARGELRRVLGRYLETSPLAVALGYGPEGKPFCTTQPPGWRICFNLSHSENVAVLAVSNGFEIGIDVEHVRPIEEGVAQTLFSPWEHMAYKALPPTERQAAFFESWTRKEACLKALGTGFALPPVHFEFDLSIHGDTAPGFVGGDAEEAKHWYIRTLPTAQAFLASVAARKTLWSVTEMK